jgi:hydroxypyruvate reductase
MAIQAATQMARDLKLNVASFETFIEGEAREVARKVGSLARHLTQAPDLIYKPAALIFGGETTVTLERSGLGGRNQEFALACAFEIQDQANLLIAAVATDGNDGPTDAAGAFVDGQTMARAAALGLDPQQYLDGHDSYHFFQALNDLVITGPTNTNVNDLILILAW